MTPPFPSVTKTDLRAAGPLRRTNMKILIPIDASERSRNAAFFATGKPALFGRDPEIHIFYAQEPASDRIRFATDPETLDAFYREEAKTVFDSIIDRCGTLPQNVTLDYGVGSPAQTIVAAADKLEADMLVMGTHGKGPIDSLIFGSVSTEVVAHSHRPILLIRDRLPTSEPLKRVAICLDESDQSLRVQGFFTQHADLFEQGTTFTLIHVQKSHEDEQASGFASTGSIAGEIEAILTRAGMNVTTKTLYGDVGAVIAHHAEEENFDMIVMGSHGYGSVSATLLGSVTMTVASECEVPLLIVR